MNPANLAMIVPIVAVLTPVLIILVVMHYRYRNMSRLHDTVLGLAEKGIPIPPELLVPPSRPKTDLRLYIALTLIGFGIGLIVFFLSSHGEWGLGAIPLAVGVAQMIAWWVERREIKAPQNTSGN